MTFTESRRKTASFLQFVSSRCSAPTIAVLAIAVCGALAASGASAQALPWVGAGSPDPLVPTLFSSLDAFDPPPAGVPEAICELDAGSPCRPSLLACMPRAPSYHDSLNPSAASAAALDDESTRAIASRAFDALAAHRAMRRVPEALIALATLRELVPELTDRWDRIEGELLPHERRGCDALERAIESPLASIAASARVARVECLLAQRDRDASDELRQLLARYPELPEANALRLMEAAALEEAGDLARAIAIYRDVDRVSPESAAASSARERLEQIAASGHRVRPLSALQLVERADRLVRYGPPDLAREEVDRLRAMRLPAPHHAEVVLMAARIARVEGRWQDAARLAREARGLSPELEEDGAAIEAQARDFAAAARAREEEAARHDLRRWTNGARTLRAIQTTRIFGYLRSAARAGLRSDVDRALDELATRDELPCGLRLEAGVLASGSGDDLRVARVLERCVDARGAIGTASRYHRARALERAGLREQALAELERVIAEDTSDTRWYAMWARQRREALAIPDPPSDPYAIEPQAELAHDASADDAGKTGESGPPGMISSAPAPVAAPDRAPTPAVEIAAPAEPEPEDGAFDARGPAFVPLDDAAIERRLEALAAAYGAGFVWFPRALALFRLGDREGTADELHEAMLAWNQARGRGTMRAGLEAVYRGATPPRVPTPSIEAWRLRRQLDAAARQDLADIAASLGDHGLAIRFAGPERAAARPRAYESIVREVARERGIDHNLLFAVMRVESVYSPRIVSYAGAIGLLQIMPRTGRLIARSMGREERFGIDDLLDPRTNIELSAWYLSSLIRRFEGRVPLAIAAYNGGPHNVRRWLRDHAPNMPIDAFCERIPFEQTHRYVRRVLSHWAAYRAQEGLPMPELDPSLPDLETDQVAF